MSPVCLGRQIEEPKNTWTHETNIFHTSFCRSPKFKDLWKFVFFLETQDSQTSGKMYSFVFLNTQSIWSYVKCLYLWQSFLKNSCKSMENRTLRDTRSENQTGKNKGLRLVTRLEPTFLRCSDSTWRNSPCALRTKQAVHCAFHSDPGRIGFGRDRTQRSSFLEQEHNFASTGHSLAF